MLNKKKWIYNESDKEKINKLEDDIKISPKLAEILVNRGIDTAGKVRSFLDVSLKDLHNPFLLADMEKAVNRIMESIKKKERIAIYGDYDVDGITSASVLYKFLKAYETDIFCYIPDRLDEGYGISDKGINIIKEWNADIIITVDCGITAFSEVEQIKIMGMDVIITDHHQCGESLPDAYAVINPCRNDCGYPFKHLAGVGVVFKLIEALCSISDRGFCHLDFLDLVSLGTVADLVPLVDENRIIVKHGLEKINRSPCNGLKKLIDVSKYGKNGIDTTGLAFGIAPRVNAAGRMGHAYKAFKLFTSEDDKEMTLLASRLDRMNRERQILERGILDEAVNIIETQELYKDNVIVVANDNWHVGVIGITASRITEKFYKPSIVISFEESEGKGSARSIEGINIFNELNSCSECLEKFGGHEMAAGITIRKENIESFRKMVNKTSSQLNDNIYMPELKIDLQVKPEDITMELAKEVVMLAPFGTGNQIPVLSCCGLKKDNVRTVGEGRHLKLEFDVRGKIINGIGFNKGVSKTFVDSYEYLDAAFRIEINNWNNRNLIQMNIVDLMPSGKPALIDRYYYSLDRVFAKFASQKVFSAPVDEKVLIDHKEILENVNKGMERSNNIVFFVNSVNYAGKLKEKFEGKFNIRCKICYYRVETFNKAHLNIVINPDLNRPFLMEEKNTSLFIYGPWVDRRYVEVLVERFSQEVESIFVCSNIAESFDILTDIIPKRDDMAEVYGYLKAKGRGKIIIDNLFEQSNIITRNNRVDMNYFKLKRILDIFDEVKLIEKKEVGRFGAEICFMEHAGPKKDLEKSEIYRTLQLIKENKRLEA